MKRVELRNLSELMKITLDRLGCRILDTDESGDETILYFRCDTKQLKKKEYYYMVLGERTKVDLEYGKKEKQTRFSLVTA